MTRRRWKSLLLALTAIAACFLPVLSLEAFLYLCAAVAALVGTFALLIFLEFYAGFRRFEAWTLEESRRLRRIVVGPKPYARLVKR